MKPSRLYFGKELEEMDYSEIEKFFEDEQFETNSLEFKSASGDMQDQENDIMRNTPAMLNSEGGLIIWSAPQEQRVPGKKEGERESQIATQRTKG